MKYGILSYERKKLSLNGRDTQNMGDWVQTIAMEMLYNEWGIDNYIKVSRNDAHDYDGEYVVLPINGFNTFVNRVSYKTKTFPLSAKIIPVFFSFHLHDFIIDKEIKDQFKRYEPIGCRDEETMKNMRDNGIDAYLSGCVTALFPKRKDKEYTKICGVDLPKGIEEYMPDNIKNNLECYSALYRIKRTDGPDIMTEKESMDAYSTAKKMLDYYRDNAALVITSRLHIASPCMAMGIPVILVKEEFDGRFSWIDKFLPLYEREEWRKINWNPIPVEYEEFKISAKEFLYKKIVETYDNNVERYIISEFYENRNRSHYNRFLIQQIKRIGSKVGKKCKYSLWGVINKTIIVNNVIREIYPEWKLEEVYDLMVKGKFEGKCIRNPLNLDVKTDVIYIVVAPKAQVEAKKIVSQLKGKYVLINFDGINWENNL